MSLSLLHTSPGAVRLRQWRQPLSSERLSQSRRRVVVHAAKQKKGSSGSSDEGEAAEPSTEDRLAALEAKFGKTGKGGKPSFAKFEEEKAALAAAEAAKAAAEAARASSPAASVEVGGGFKKLADAWLAPKGGLYWLNELSFKAVIGLAGAWVLFRFVGPALGIYSLQNNLIDP